MIDLPTGGDRVTFGSTVRLEDEAGKEVRYQIVGSDEADPKRGRISILAPLARTLIGKSVGDSVTAPAAERQEDLRDPRGQLPSARAQAGARWPPHSPGREVVAEPRHGPAR